MGVDVNLDLVDRRMTEDDRESFYDAIAKYLYISEESISEELFDRIDNNISNNYKIEYDNGQVILSHMNVSNYWCNEKNKEIPVEIRKQYGILTIDELFEVVKNDFYDQYDKDMLKYIDELKVDCALEQYIIQIYITDDAPYMKVYDSVIFVEDIAKNYGYSVRANIYKHDRKLETLMLEESNDNEQS